MCLVGEKMQKDIISDTYNLMLTIPEFKKFVKENENKTTEEIIIKYNLNLDLFRRTNVQKSKSKSVS